jgi:DtxR family Mn-dependent transcriptional regulator
VAVSGSTESEIVTFLEDLGVVPGAEVRVIEKHPFDGPLVVEVAGKTRTLGERVARQVYVTRTLRSRQSAPSTSSAGSAPSASGTAGNQQ